MSARNFVTARLDKKRESVAFFDGIEFKNTDFDLLGSNASNDDQQQQENAPHQIREDEMMPPPPPPAQKKRRIKQEITPASDAPTPVADQQQPAITLNEEQQPSASSGRRSSFHFDNFNFDTIHVQPRPEDFKQKPPIAAASSTTGKRRKRFVLHSKKSTGTRLTTSLRYSTLIKQEQLLHNNHQQAHNDENSNSQTTLQEQQPSRPRSLAALQFTSKLKKPNATITPWGLSVSQTRQNESQRGYGAMFSPLADVQNFAFVQQNNGALSLTPFKGSISTAVIANNQSAGVLGKRKRVASSTLSPALKFAQL